MKRVIEYFVNNSIMVNFLTIFILVIGVISINSIQKELRPSISIDKVFIITSYTGASPETVEKLVTIPIEDDLSAIYGIDKIESLSFTGSSQIVVDIDSDVSNKSDVVQEIFRVVQNVSDIPEEATEPRVIEIKSKVWPIYGVAVYGDVEKTVLRKWANILRDEIETVSGVSSAEVTGVRDPAVDVVVDPNKLNNVNLSISEIISTLKKWNQTSPAGYIHEGILEIPVRLDQSLDEVDRIENLIVRINDNGHGVRIRDVAKVQWGLRNNRKLNRYNAQNNVQVTISKKEDADTITTVKKIKKAIEKFEKKLPPNIKTLEYRNDSTRIKSKLRSVTQNALIGLVLVVVILLLLLNIRIALVTALGLPIALFGSIWALEAMGYTLNSVTIIGIILVVGMLVDDGIVVAENIFYHFEKGRSRTDAAIEGTREVMIPVFGTVLTTIIAFLPLVFMSGVVGKFMATIPVAVITCLTFSLIECFIILPNHAADFMRKSRSVIVEKLNAGLRFIYIPLLLVVVRLRWIVTPIILMVAIMISVFYLSDFKMRMFPVRGITRFNMNIEGPANARLEETDVIVKVIEKSLAQDVGKYITGFRTIVGALYGRRGMAYEGPNTAGFRVYLVDERDLDIDPRALVKQIRQKINKLMPEKWKLSFEVGRHGPPMGKAVEIEIGHNDFAKSTKVSKIIESKLKTIEGAADVGTDLLHGFSEYILTIDQKKASVLGIDPTMIQQITMSAFEGISATTIRRLDDEYDVMVFFPKANRENPDNFLNLKIRTKYETYVPLRKIASIRKVDSIGAIKHINEKRTITVMASLAGKKVTGYEINKIMEKFIKENISDQFPDVQIKLGGEEEERREMLTEIAKLFGLALLAIYMVLSMVFNSPFYPFFVIFVIPFGFVGALISLSAYGEIMSFPALISFVGLTGVVVNDAILLVTFIRNRYHETSDMIKAIVEAAIRRLRPIFLTTVTTVVGLLPAIYEIGGPDANMRIMAIVIAWGLLLASIITMIFIPGFMGCIYDIVNLLKFGYKGKGPDKKGGRPCRVCQ